MNAVETRSLRKSYGKIEALTGLDLHVPTGVIFGFLGPNGAGKTTTLRILVGLLRASAGQATVLGFDAWAGQPNVCSRVGYLPGDVKFPDWMSGAAFLAFCDRGRGGGSGREIERLRERFGLEIERKIRDYSRGMKQKLGLIQALMHRPEVLLLDEPATGLDPLMQQELYEELRAVAEEGRTVLFSSHTLSEVEQLCTRVGIIRAGRLIEDSTIVELRKRALRSVEIRLRNADTESLDLPEGLDAIERRDGMIVGTWQGPVPRLLRWLTDYNVADLSIGTPSLEDVFATYYQRNGDEPVAGRKGT